MFCCSKVLFTVLKEIKPDDDLEKVETCRLIDCIVKLCASILSRNTYFAIFTIFLGFVKVSSILQQKCLPFSPERNFRYRNLSEICTLLCGID
jgi:hypothetical protein